MTEPVNPPQNQSSTQSAAAQPQSDPVVQRILAASAGIGQLAQLPLPEVAERLDALHSELQAALVDVDNSAKN